MSQPKPSRGRNFTNEEVEKLIGLISNHGEVLEMRQSDANVWKKKERAWKNISHYFNVDCDVTEKRSVDQLKKKYDNLKKEAKKKLVMERQESIRTGSGSSSDNWTSANETISSLYAENVAEMNSRFTPDYIDDNEDGYRTPSPQTELDVRVPTRRKRISTDDLVDESLEEKAKFLKMRRVHEEACQEVRLGNLLLEEKFKSDAIEFQRKESDLKCAALLAEVKLKNLKIKLLESELKIKNVLQ